MRSLLFLASSVFLLSFQACAQSDYLVFGKGGGFTGDVLQYKITPRGKIYKGSGLAEIRYTLAGKIKRSEARKLFEEVNSISDSAFHHPGNVYYFIRQADDMGTIEYTWGEPGFTVNEAIRTLYKNTMSRLSETTYKTLKKPVE